MEILNNLIAKNIDQSSLTMQPIIVPRRLAKLGVQLTLSKNTGSEPGGYGIHVRLVIKSCTIY